MTDTIGKTCSHGIPWTDHCPQCELVSARETVAHWGEAVDKARSVIESAAKTGNFILKVADKPFRCSCGCNVFHHPPSDPEVFACNACDLCYEGL
jgi:hypothetical protein